MTKKSPSLNPFDTYHLAPVSYDKNGIPYADAPFTSKQDTKRHAVIVPPSKVVPVVFLPGIMGSNLMLKTLPQGFEKKRFKTGVDSGWEWPPVHFTTEGWGDRAWRPDDTLNFMSRRFWPLEAHERRILLDPANTQVDNRAEIPSAILEEFTFESMADGLDREAIAEQRRRGFVHEMTRRGWGTVMLSSYGPLLAYLEKNLNQMYQAGEINQFWRETILNRKPGDWGIIKGDKPLREADVKKVAAYWLPVHAIGYNWTQSNADSAAHTTIKINEFIAHYRKLGYGCEKVLLVTHSMGGLVARAVMHPEMGKLVNFSTMQDVRDKVLGVIHGVMPTHGAAAAYRRCRAGFEGSGVSIDSIAADILGRNGKEVAAVFSNSPGALQLLPSKLYGTGWLKVQDASGKVLLSLPKEDPYAEIYAQKYVWWRLMNPVWLTSSPGVTEAVSRRSWTGFLKNLEKAEKFHEMLSSTVHPHTHLQYGRDDQEYKAFGSIVWRPSNVSAGLHGNPTSSLIFDDHENGEVRLYDVKVRLGRTEVPTLFELSGKDESGDGTVPIRSAAALNDAAEVIATHTGYDHQSSFLDDRAKALVVYGVVRLIAENIS